MSLAHILVLLAAGIAYRWISRRRAAPWLLLASGVLAVFLLQPSTPIRHLDFWLPTASLGLTCVVWALTRPPEERGLREPALAFGLVCGLVLLIGLTRFLEPPWRLTPSRPPAPASIALALAVSGVLACLAHRVRSRKAVLFAGIAGITAAFVVLKSSDLAQAAAVGLRSLSGQDLTLAQPADLRWLGFSYLAFRLLHALRDRMIGRLPTLSLREFLTYAVFPASLTAGPIDRAERFTADLRASAGGSPSHLLAAGERLALGLLKKFVLADSLAVIALGPATASQITTAPWLWLGLYAYALQLYLDFGGYTDIAVGVGMLFGIRLPENFDRPYLKPNLTAFWNSWHITLATWFRAYFFNPVTRALRVRRLPVPAVILIGQLGTMLLIGLWHGITWNFAIWGAWHALGLFAHNRWTEFLRGRSTAGRASPWISSASRLASTLLTFHFVVLGWVWFALPSPAASLEVFRRLFGG